MDRDEDRRVAEIERACRVILHGGIRSISVVTGRPLTEAQLRRVRTYASARGVALTSDGAGTVTLRVGLQSPARRPRTAALRERLRMVWARPAGRLAGGDAS